MTAPPPPQAGNIVSRSCGICSSCSSGSWSCGSCSSWSFGSGFWPSGSSSWSSGISWCSSSSPKRAFTSSLRILSSSPKILSLSLRTLLPLSNFSRLSSGSSWIDCDVVRLWAHRVLHLEASILIVSRHANTSLKFAVLNFCFRYLFSFSFHLKITKNSSVTSRPAGELDGYQFPQLLSKLLGSGYYQLQHKLGNYSLYESPKHLACATVSTRPIFGAGDKGS